MQWREARAAFEAVFALGAPQPSHVWGAALRGAANIAECLYDCDAAIEWNRLAISIWEELGEAGWVARSRVDLGNAYINLGHFDEARVEFERAVELVDPAVELRTHRVAIGSIATTFLRQGLLEEANADFAKVTPRLRTLDDPWLLATCLSNFGVVKQRLAQLAEARGLFAESLRIRRALEDDYGVGAAMINLGGVHEDTAAGEAMSREALGTGLRIGATDLIAAARVDQAVVAFDRGDRASAASAYLEALDG